METPSFDRSLLEADMKALVAEIKSQRERPKMKDIGGKEVLKEALSMFPNLEKNKSNESSSESSPAFYQAPQGSNPASPLPAYAQTAAPEVKLEIEYLIDLALTKGIGAAFAEAGKSPYFVQDAFHDALAGRLYPELKKKGIVD